MIRIDAQRHVAAMQDIEVGGNRAERHLPRDAMGIDGSAFAVDHAHDLSIAAADRGRGPQPALVRNGTLVDFRPEALSNSYAQRRGVAFVIAEPLRGKIRSERSRARPAHHPPRRSFYWLVFLPRNWNRTAIIGSKMFR